MISIE
jgi:hypothetical protein